jgi:hypothetical protein
VHGIVASFPIAGLYFFVTFVFALIGVDAFGLSDAFHYLNGHTALYELYQVTNMEWLDSMNVQLYGCDSPMTGGFYTVFLNATYPAYTKLSKQLLYTDYYEAYRLIQEPQYIGAAYRIDLFGQIESLGPESPMLPQEPWCTPGTNVRILPTKVSLRTLTCSVSSYYFSLACEIPSDCLRNHLLSHGEWAPLE